MVFYLVGLGLNELSVTAEALKAIESSDKVYLDNYTVNFPYNLETLEKSLGVKIEPLKRSSVEDESILGVAGKKDVVLLVYGDSLSATTHLQLILSCKKKGIPYKVFHNSSILTAVAETGLSLYKFGKTASMPDWKEHTNKPTSFIGYVKDNLSIKAHTLVLTDIGLELGGAIRQLEESAFKEKVDLPKKIIVVSNAGINSQEIYYDSLDRLKSKKVKMPFCLIIPSELHFLEKEFLELFS
ncbi:MAG: diphthine synthase [Candidatus Pacearchaeota archaeon]